VQSRIEGARLEGGRAVPPLTGEEIEDHEGRGVASRDEEVITVDPPQKSLMAGGEEGSGRGLVPRRHLEHADQRRIASRRSSPDEERIRADHRASSPISRRADESFEVREVEGDDRSVAERGSLMVGRHVGEGRRRNLAGAADEDRQPPLHDVEGQDRVAEDGQLPNELDVPRSLAAGAELARGPVRAQEIESVPLGEDDIVAHERGGVGLEADETTRIVETAESGDRVDLSVRWSRRRGRDPEKQAGGRPKEKTWHSGSFGAEVVRRRSVSARLARHRRYEARVCRRSDRGCQPELAAAHLAS